MGHTAAPEMKTNETSTTTVQIKGEERICELSLDQYTLSEMWELWRANPRQRARPPKEKCPPQAQGWGAIPSYYRPAETQGVQAPNNSTEGKGRKTFCAAKHKMEANILSDSQRTMSVTNYTTLTLGPDTFLKSL